LLEKLADEKGAAKGNSALGMVIAENTKRGHDQSRKSTTAGDIAASVQLCAMEKMGDGYTEAWYLHHHLDYLHENRNSGKSFDELNEEYREEHSLTHSEEIEELLTRNRGDLIDDLGL